MPLLALPNQLLKLIVENLVLDRDLNALARTHRRLYFPINHYLYTRNIRKGGSTALLFSAETGRENIIQYMLTQGADIHTKNKNGLTPLILAAGSGNIRAVKLLLEHWDVDVNEVAEYEVYLYKDSYFSYYAQKYETAVIAAARRGHEEILKLLLSRREINLRGRRGGVALAQATLGNQERTTKMLLGQQDVDVIGTMSGKWRLPQVRRPTSPKRRASGNSIGWGFE